MKTSTITKTRTMTTAGASRASRTRQQDLQVMLEDRQRELQSVIQRRVRDVSADASGGGLDESEHAEIDIQEHIEVALIQMKEETLQRLREALVRLDAGEYGYCADCEDEISEIRLQALPFAVRCTGCEAVLEQRAARDRRHGATQSFPLIFAEQSGS